MSVSNVSPQFFETTVDAYDPDYHWGGVSIYPEGPIPSGDQYPGLPAGMTLPPGLPINLDYFVTPAPPHLAHIPLECPGAPRPDKKPVKRKAVKLAPLQINSKPRQCMGIYGPTRRLPSNRPTFVYAYPCAAEERWAHLPEHLRPLEENPRVQTHNSIPLEAEDYESEPEFVSLQVSRPQQASDSTSSQSRPSAHVSKALQNFRAQFGE
ncbi:unnamed protein product [Rhizoctonia solani]|uniref:Uncharacterized protein n=1 Tax=Rhizoctonia solani TaxID=456999 RepID=A0A8H3B532_9AGAM|nr:unnamed protein product [Rhizoctonia solani]